MTYMTALIATLVGGLVPALIFLVWHGVPKYWRSIAAADASSWVLVIVALYGWSLFRLLTAPVGARAWDWSAVVSISIGLLFDAVLWLRLAHWVVRGRQESVQRTSGRSSTMDS